MKDNRLQELEKHFNSFIKVEDPDEFHSGITAYFRFIENTHPFKDIAQNLFYSSSSPSIVRNLHSLYKWFVFNKENPQKSISPASVEGSGISIFHRMMIENAKQAGLTSHNKIKIVISKKDTMIYLFDDETRNYPIKSRGKYKHDIPQRLRIILILAKQIGGISAEKLTEKLGTKDISGTRKEIRQINRHFRNKVSDSGDIIYWNDNSGKNIYSLNHELFDFVIE